MTSSTFVSYAQNREDVVLWRALGHVQNGCYVDVGANDPETDSVTRAFYDRGWRGIDIEPVPHFAERLRDQRPGDRVVEAAVTHPAGPRELFEVKGTGLSTLDARLGEAYENDGRTTRRTTVPGRTLNDIVDECLPEGSDIHFLKVDAEGSEGEVMRSIDLATWRPWVIVAESTIPNTNQPNHEDWEQVLLGAGYAFCLFDGLSRFYVASERRPVIGELLSYPACPLDDYVLRSHADLEQRVELLTEESLRWRSAALHRWSEALETTRPSSVDLDERAQVLARELEAMRATLSWRVTKPLRAARARHLRAPHGGDAK